MKKKHKIVILDGEVLNPGDLTWDGITKWGECKIYENTPLNEIIQRIGDADIVFTNKTPISQLVIEKTSIAYIGLFSTGYNIIDLEAAKKKGIIVSNVPAYSSNAVAQLTFALLLELCHRVQWHSDEVHQGVWSRSQNFCFWSHPQIELTNKTLGIIGYGNIGSHVARIAFAFDMRVLIYTRTPKKEIEDDNLQFVDLSKLLAESDVVSLHCPLLAETENLIDKLALSMMKPSAFVINTARGAIVNEADMRNALDKKIIAGFATDVAHTEPIPANSPLLNAPNCIITPHIAWVALETRKRLLNTVVENLEAFLKNTPQNVVNE